MPVNALNTTSTKFEETHLESTSITSTGGSIPFRKRAFFTPSLDVTNTDTVYFLTLNPGDIKDNYGIMVKGSLNLKNPLQTPPYEYSYLFEIYTSINLSWTFNSFPTTSTPGTYFFTSLNIKNQTAENAAGLTNPFFQQLLASEDDIVELNPSGTNPPDIRFGLNFGSTFGKGEWVVSGMVYTY